MNLIARPQRAGVRELKASDQEIWEASRTEEDTVSWQGRILGLGGLKWRQFRLAFVGIASSCRRHEDDS